MHRQKLRHALLDILKPVVIPLEDLLRLKQVFVVLTHVIPRHGQQRLDIIAACGVLARVGPESGEPLDLLADCLLHGVGCLQRIQLVHIFITRGLRVITEFRADDLELFA